MQRTSKKITSKSQDKVELNNENNLIDLTSTDIKKLIKKGKEKKILTWDEINKAIPEGSLSSDQIEDLHASIDQLGITVVDKDEDLSADIILFDNNENGIVEIKIEFAEIDGQRLAVYSLDDDEDDEFDTIGFDFDLDGKVDIIEPITN